MPTPANRTIRFTISKSDLDLFRKKYPDTKANHLAKQVFTGYLHDLLVYNTKRYKLEVQLKRQMIRKLRLENKILQKRLDSSN